MRAVIAAFCGVLLLGCKGGSTPSGPSSGIPLPSREELKVDALPYEVGQLNVAGLKIKVKLARFAEGEKVHFDLRAMGQTFERELYLFDGNTFCLAEGGGEVYDPPLPIIRFGANIGEPLEIDSTMKEGDTPHKVHSRSVTSSPEDIMVGGSLQHNGIKAAITLTIDTQPAPITRELNFWFSPGSGIVKREFGKHSVRMPLEE